MEWWLETQPREVAVAFAARVVLRVLPFVQSARGRGFAGIVLPVFRATAVAWAVGRYPAQATTFADAARAASAAARAANRAANRAAVWAAADVASVADAAARAAAYGIRGAASWSAVSADATRVDEGAAASDIAGSPLWPQGQPAQLQSLWREMKVGLHAANQDWQVWTNWYDNRLDGRALGEELELAYVRIEEALWKQGPAIVNAEIKGRIEELEPPNPVVGPTGPIMADIEPPASETNTHFIGRYQPTVFRSSPYNSGDSGADSMGVTEPAISAVPVDNPPIAGAATQHLSEILAAWQTADAALQTPQPRRQYVPDVLVNPVALADTPTAPRPWANTLATIPESPFGNKWTERGDRFAIDPRGNETDDTAALDPVVRQLHEAVRRKAIAFATNLTGIDDRIGWTGFEDAIERFRDAVDVDTVAIPSRIATVYDATIEFASFLEFDNDLRERFEGNVTPLNPTARRAFEDLVRTAAPWIRRFPTACTLDDETGALLLRRDLYEPSRAVVEGARNAALISTEDRDLLKALLSAFERGGFPAQKAGTRGILSTRNLIVVALTTAVTCGVGFYSSAVSSDFANRSELVKKIGTFLAAEESQVLRIMGDATTDLRLAISSLLAELKHSYGDNHSSTPSTDHHAIVERPRRQEDGK